MGGVGEVNPYSSMMGVDSAGMQYYTSRLNSVARQKADFVGARLPSLADPNIVIDIGCMDGDVATLLKERHPKTEIHGIDINPAFIERARLKHGNSGVTFRVQRAEDGLPYAGNSVTAVAALAILHEVYSFNQFDEEPVVELLADIRRILRPGGRLIIRETAKPDNPDELLAVTLSRIGENPPTDEAIVELDPALLSQDALMKLFLLQFEPLRRQPEASDWRTYAQGSSFVMPAWLVSEFVRKRTNVGDAAVLASEMQEQNGAFTARGLARLAIEAGFGRDYVTAESVFEENFYGAVDDSIMRLADVNGGRVGQKDRLPSHIYGVLEKA